MKVGFRLRGRVIGIEPTPRPGTSGDAQFPVYTNRDAVGAWEEAELTAHADGTFDARFLSANKQLSMTPSGELESRAAGQIGAWETFFATDQPDGSSLLYRFEGDVLLDALTIEAVS